MWQGINQRRFPRVKSRCVIKLRQAGGTSSISTVTENIGLGGVCVLMDRGLDIFSPVELELTVEDGKPPIRSQGTIVWVVLRRDIKRKQSFDTGIEFSGLSPDDKSRLEALLDKIAPATAP
ncbi:MAG: PilZ domain-containing protein [Candidatus Omnitrophica bacterium]|nr:PilZ domain-containing protein [Candidatus Omnitrophota bacterium]